MGLGASSRSVGLFLLLAIIMVVLDSLQPSGFARDVDDILRGIQIRDLLSDGDWFDLVLPGIGLEDTYLSPWSRLVDLPYVLFSLVLSLFIDPSLAFQISCMIVPPLMLIVFTLGLFSTTRAVLGREVSVLDAVVMYVVCLLAIPEFAPFRIDHHNFQLVFIIWAIWGLVSANRYSGFVLGLMTVLSVAVGLECLPFFAVIYGCNLVYAASGNLIAREKLMQAGLSLLACTVPISSVLIGPAAITAIHCDALSLPFVIVLTISGAVLRVVPAVFWPEKGKVVN